MNSWIQFNEKIDKTTDIEAKKKRDKQSKKLQILDKKRENLSGSFEPDFIEDFVVNKSNVNFSEDELKLLNKGLKYTPKPNKLPLIEAAVDIETILKYKLPSIQNNIREAAVKVFQEAKSQQHIRKNKIDECQSR